MRQADSLENIVQNHGVSSQTYRHRRIRLVELLEEKKLDGYLFSGKSDLFYLTGFLADGFYGLFTTRGSWLFCSALMAGQLREYTQGCHLVVGKRLSLALRELRTRHRLRQMGFDSEQVFYRLGTVLMKEALRPKDNPLAELRAIKDKEELSCLRRACHVTAQAIDFIRPRLRVGLTEIGLARKIESFFQRRSQGNAFDLVVAIGDHTSLPHHVPTDRRLSSGQPVILDIGCTVGGYRSDLTRTLFYGKIPALLQRIFGVVQAAQRAGIERVRPGVTGGQVDAAARGFISRSGYGRYFVHSTGHGVGIDIHEPPWIRTKSQDLLKPGMILTVEPGIYLPGRFGVRIEDTLAVTETGHEVLTR